MCFKKQEELLFIKNQEEVKQRPATERYTILNEKAKMENFLYIKSQEKVLVVGCNKKTYYYTKGQNKESVSYQELKMVFIGRNKKTYHFTKGQDRKPVTY